MRPALNPEEYTVLRARWITVYGLCACARPGVWVPEVVAVGDREGG